MKNKFCCLFQTSFWAWLCIIDILFMPYMRLFSCSIAMIVVLIWYLRHINKFIHNYRLQFILLAIIASIICGMSANSRLFHNYITQGILVIYHFLFYFFFYYYFKRNNVTLKNILLIYMIAFGIFALIYNIAPLLYFNIRAIWTMSGIVPSSIHPLLNRFAFIFSDANNAGCMAIIVFAYLLYCEKLTIFEITFYYFLLMYVVLSTLSVSGIILYCLLTLSMFICIFYKNTLQEMRIGILCIMILLSIILLVLYVTKYIDILTDIPIMQNISYRVGVNSNNNLGGRISIWLEILQSISPFAIAIIGHGIVVDNNGNIYNPHSVHLLFIYSYGVIAYLIYLYTFFKIKINVCIQYYIPIFFIFCIMSVNTGILDYRFMALASLLIAKIHSVISKSREIIIIT